MTKAQILAAASAVVFTYLGVMHVAGAPKKMWETRWERSYSKWDMTRQQLMLVGVLEWLGSAMLFAFAFGGWAFGVWGAAVHAGLMVGAIRLHTKHGTIMDAVPAIVMLVVSSLILVGWPPRAFW